MENFNPLELSESEELFYVKLEQAQELAWAVLFLYKMLPPIPVEVWEWEVADDVNGIPCATLFQRSTEEYPEPPALWAKKTTVYTPKWDNMAEAARRIIQGSD
jgi:hypothetical protein